MTEPSDEALIEALEADDRRVVGQLFDRYYDELFAYADRTLGDPNAAADAVQETFLRVLRYGRTFGGRSSFRTWIMRVQRHVCLDLVEQRTRHRRNDDALPRPQAVAPAVEPDPRILLLREALEQLPANRREVLVLRRFHGLSYAEIGEICGISEGAARVRAHRALAQLRDELAPSSETVHD